MNPLPSFDTAGNMILKGMLLFVVAIALNAGQSNADERRVASPDGTIRVVISDDGGLCFRVEVDQRPVLAPSKLGLEFSDGASFGPLAKIENVSRSSKDSTWDNPFGKRRVVRGRWNQMRLMLRESEESERRYGLAVRVGSANALPNRHGPREGELR